MARIDNLNNCLTDIADAIREKTGITEEIPVSQYDEKIRGIQSGGIDINGIIEEYKVAAGESVSAGDFVEFVNEYNVILEKSKQSIVNDNYYGFFPIFLNDKKIFVAYCRSSSYYLSGIILSFDNETIEKSSIYSISGSNYGTSIKLEKLSENEIIVLHGTNTGNKLYIQKVTISSNDEIVVGEQFEIGSCYKNSEIFSFIQNGKLIIFSLKSGGILQVTICSINNNEFIIENQKDSDSKFTGSDKGCFTVEKINNDFCILNLSSTTYSNNNTIFIRMCKIGTDMEIDFAISTEISNLVSSQVSMKYISNNNNIYIQYSTTTGNNVRNFYGVLLKINKDTFDIVDKKMLKTGASSSGQHSSGFYNLCYILSKNDIYIIFSNQYAYLCQMFVKIINDKIYDSDIMVIDTNKSTYFYVLYSSIANRFFIFYNYSNYLYYVKKRKISKK